MPDHDILIGIREGQRSFSIEVERRFQQIIKENFEICGEIKDLVGDVKDGFCKVDKRWGDLDKRMAIIEMKQEDNEKFKDQVTANIAKTTTQVYKDMDDRDEKLREDTRRQIQVYIAIGTAIGSFIGWALGFIIH